MPQIHTYIEFTHKNVNVCKKLVILWFRLRVHTVERKFAAAQKAGGRSRDKFKTRCYYCSAKLTNHLNLILSWVLHCILQGYNVIFLLLYLCESKKENKPQQLQQQNQWKWKTFYNDFGAVDLVDKIVYINFHISIFLKTILCQGAANDDALGEVFKKET